MVIAPLQGRRVREDGVPVTSGEGERCVVLCTCHKAELSDPFVAFALHLFSERTVVAFYFRVSLARLFYKLLS